MTNFALMGPRSSRSAKPPGRSSAAGDSVVEAWLLGPVAGAMGLQAVFALSALCSLAASILLMRLPPPSEG